MEQAEAKNELSDEELMVALQAGDTDALGEISVRYGPRMYRHISSRVHDHQAAEDILQEVWIHLLKKADKFDVTQRFSPWLYSLVRNLTLDHLRRSQKDMSLPTDFVAPKGNTCTYEPQDTRAPARHREEFSFLYEALNKISENQRKAVLHLGILEEDTQLYAKRTGTVPATLRWRLNNGKKVLKSVLLQDARQSFIDFLEECDPELARRLDGRTRVEPPEHQGHEDGALAQSLFHQDSVR